MSLTAPERETIITLNDEDETADIWTAQRPWITRLKKTGFHARLMFHVRLMSHARLMDCGYCIGLRMKIQGI